MMTQKSSEVIVAKYCKRGNAKELLLAKDLRPLARELRINYKGKDKGWLIIDIAKQLMETNRVEVTGRLSCITREDVHIQ